VTFQAAGFLAGSRVPEDEIPTHRGSQTMAVCKKDDGNLAMMGQLWDAEPSDGARRQ